MNDETKRYLKDVAAQREEQQRLAMEEPGIKQQAETEYSILPQTMQTLIKQFNESVEAKQLSLQLRLDGPVSRSDRQAYLLALTGGKSGMKGRVLLLETSIDGSFNNAEITTSGWPANLTIDAVKNGVGGYAPNERPTRQGGVMTYKQKVLDSTFNWVSNQGGKNYQFPALFNTLIHELVKYNVPG